MCGNLSWSVPYNRVDLFTLEARKQGFNFSERVCQTKQWAFPNNNQLFLCPYQLLLHNLVILKKIEKATAGLSGISSNFYVARQRHHWLVIYSPQHDTCIKNYFYIIAISAYKAGTFLYSCVIKTCHNSTPGTSLNLAKWRVETKTSNSFLMKYQLQSPS